MPRKPKGSAPPKGPSLAEVKAKIAKRNLSKKEEIDKLKLKMQTYVPLVVPNISLKQRRYFQSTYDYARHLQVIAPTAGFPEERYGIQVNYLCPYNFYESTPITIAERAYFTGLDSINGGNYDATSGLIIYTHTNGAGAVTQIPSVFPRTNVAVGMSNVLKDHLSREVVSSAQLLIQLASLDFKARIGTRSVVYAFPAWKVSDEYFSTNLVTEDDEALFNLAYGTFGTYGGVCELELFKSIKKVHYDRMLTVVPTTIIPAGNDSARLSTSTKDVKLTKLKKTMCCPYCHKAVWNIALECEHFLAWLAAYLCLDFTIPDIWSLILFYTCKHCNQSVTGHILPKAYPATVAEIANNGIHLKNPGFDGKLAFAYKNTPTFTQSRFGTEAPITRHDHVFSTTPNPDGSIDPNIVRDRDVKRLFMTAQILEDSVVHDDVIAQRKTCITLPTINVMLTEEVSYLAANDYNILSPSDKKFMYSEDFGNACNFVLGSLMMMSYKDKHYFIQLLKMYRNNRNYYAKRYLKHILHNILHKKFILGTIGVSLSFHKPLYGGATFQLDNIGVTRDIIRLIKIIINKNKYFNNEYDGENKTSTEILHELIAELYVILLTIPINKYVTMEDNIKYLDNKKFEQNNQLIEPIIQELLTFLLNKKNEEGEEVEEGEEGEDEEGEDEDEDDDDEKKEGEEEYRLLSKKYEKTDNRTLEDKFILIKKIIIETNILKTLILIVLKLKTKNIRNTKVDIPKSVYSKFYLKCIEQLDIIHYLKIGEYIDIDNPNKGSFIEESFIDVYNKNMEDMDNIYTPYINENNRILQQQSTNTKSLNTPLFKSVEPEPSYQQIKPELPKIMAGGYINKTKHKSKNKSNNNNKNKGNKNKSNKNKKNKSNKNKK
jgi:hypothetical protein